MTPSHEVESLIAMWKFNLELYHKTYDTISGRRQFLLGKVGYVAFQCHEKELQYLQQRIKEGTEIVAALVDTKEDSIKLENAGMGWEEEVRKLHNRQEEKEKRDIAEQEYREYTTLNKESLSHDAHLHSVHETDHQLHHEMEEADYYAGGDLEVWENNQVAMDREGDEE